jgi:hypothetical protein
MRNIKFSNSCNDYRICSVDESDLFQSYVADKNVADKPIKKKLCKPFPIVKQGTH